MLFLTIVFKVSAHIEEVDTVSLRSLWIYHRIYLEIGAFLGKLVDLGESVHFHSGWEWSSRSYTIFIIADHFLSLVLLFVSALHLIQLLFDVCRSNVQNILSFVGCIGEDCHGQGWFSPQFVIDLFFVMRFRNFFLLIIVAGRAGNCGLRQKTPVANELSCRKCAHIVHADRRWGGCRWRDLVIVQVVQLAETSFK